MTRWTGNEGFGLDEMWNAIVNLMDDEIRESVHRELAPCTNDEFLTRYTELDPEFEEMLENEFSIVRVEQ
jgi:hypothetical protein